MDSSLQLNSTLAGTNGILGSSTNHPDILEESTSHIGTIVIFVASALLTITLLFILAVFIDCRQQKLNSFKFQRRHKRTKFSKASQPTSEENVTIVDKMQVQEGTSFPIVHKV